MSCGFSEPLQSLRRDAIRWWFLKYLLTLMMCFVTWLGVTSSPSRFSRCDDQPYTTNSSFRSFSCCLITSIFFSLSVTTARTLHLKCDFASSIAFSASDAQYVAVFYGSLCHLLIGRTTLIRCAHSWQ